MIQNWIYLLINLKRVKNGDRTMVPRRNISKTTQKIWKSYAVFRFFLLSLFTNWPTLIHIFSLCKFTWTIQMFYHFPWTKLERPDGYNSTFNLKAFWTEWALFGTLLLILWEHMWTTLIVWCLCKCFGINSKSERKHLLNCIKFQMNVENVEPLS